jgi:peptide/nickel transport system ATP-binding protein
VSGRDTRDRGGPGTPLVAVTGLVKHFGGGGLPWASKPVVRAVDGLSFTIEKGATIGVVGESGCGKSTLARVLMGIIQPDAGQILFDGERIGSPQLPLRAYRSQAQMVFQDSYASLNPRLTVEATVSFGAMAQGAPKQAALRLSHDLLARVGLEPKRFADRYPHELSGGQRQRVNIARSLALEPRLLILDEAVSALDKSVEAQVLNLLLDLKQQFNLTYVFISHDLNVVRYISDDVLVMYLGKIVERGSAEKVFANPKHPYTAALLSSMPTLDPTNRTKEAPITGDPPNPIKPPSGCRFHPRCRFAKPECSVIEPQEVSVDAHAVACHLFGPGHVAGRDAA